jgi:hypothetical protein
MRFSHLLEANIPVREIEREARAAIMPLIKDHLQELWRDYIDRYPDVVHGENWHEDRFQLFDEFNSHLRQSPETLIRGLLWKPGTALGQYSSDKTGARVRVGIECRQFSEDPSRHYGGYFNRSPAFDRAHSDYIIKCFVDELWVLETVSEAMHEIVFDESAGSGTAKLANQIVSIFVHEFVHLEQEVRNPQRPSMTGKSNDLGITTVGGGKRGNRRDPRGGNIGWARYTGSLHEIEAFASQTAVEMISEIRLHSYQDEPDPGQIDDLLASLAQGYGNSSGLRSMSHMHLYWEEFEKSGVKASERDKVWNRYLKLTYQKIWQWRRDRVGKSELYQSERMKKHPAWLKQAKKGMVECAHQIAYDVAFQNYWDVSPSNPPERIAAWDSLALEGVNFIEQYFFGGYNSTAVDSMKVSVSMQKLIANKIGQLARENNQQG